MASAELTKTPEFASVPELEKAPELTSVAPELTVILPATVSVELVWLVIVPQMANFAFASTNKVTPWPTVRTRPEGTVIKSKSVPLSSAGSPLAVPGSAKHDSSPDTS